MTLKVYADRFSQPCRAILIFCKINGIDFEEITIEVLKLQQFTPEYKEINPMSEVPAIVDGGFKLFESHAILIYLACTNPGVADHWYPADIFKRTKIHSLLDWHHSHLRRGASNSNNINRFLDVDFENDYLNDFILVAGLVYNTILAPLYGLPSNPRAVDEAKKILPKSLSILDDFWLQGSGQFLLGNSEPSIADLSLVCEIMQLEFLSEKDYLRILSPYKKVLQWIKDTKNATAPYFDEIHMTLFNAQKGIREHMLTQSVSSPEGGRKSEVYSEM
uniref:Glutathione transferase n=1 Tax=Lactuca sativa TaxID=4236 RepID=A0A9R1UZV4_LACSA|nr:hypothetical protein LSAT_V11C700367650 [Lactuca sativa]